MNSREVGLPVVGYVSQSPVLDKAAPKVIENFLGYSVQLENNNNLPCRKTHQIGCMFLHTAGAPSWEDHVKPKMDKLKNCGKVLAFVYNATGDHIYTNKKEWQKLLPTFGRTDQNFMILPYKSLDELNVTEHERKKVSDFLTRSETTDKPMTSETNTLKIDSKTIDTETPAPSKFKEFNFVSRGVALRQPALKFMEEILGFSVQFNDPAKTETNELGCLAVGARASGRPEWEMVADELLKLKNCSKIFAIVVDSSGLDINDSGRNSLLQRKKWDDFLPNFKLNDKNFMLLSFKLIEELGADITDEERRKVREFLDITESTEKSIATEVSPLKTDPKIIDAEISKLKKTLDCVKKIKEIVKEHPGLNAVMISPMIVVMKEEQNKALSLMQTFKGQSIPLVNLEKSDIEDAIADQQKIIAFLEKAK